MVKSRRDYLGLEKRAKRRTSRTKRKVSRNIIIEEFELDEYNWYDSDAPEIMWCNCEDCQMLN